MSLGRETTGTRDTTYDLVSVLYHALQGAETYERYVRDAIASSDYEIATYFREVQEEERRRADKAKAVLAKVLASRLPAATDQAV
jgi:rubrerythrin